MKKHVTKAIAVLEAKNECYRFGIEAVADCMGGDIE